MVAEIIGIGSELLLGQIATLMLNFVAAIIFWE